MRLKFKFGDKDKSRRVLRAETWTDCCGDNQDMAVAAVFKTTKDQLGEAPVRVRIYWADGQYVTFKVAH